MALVVAAATTGAWPACETHEPSAGALDVDPGPTFGAEIAVTIVGRGRVTAAPGGIDCPSTCFARVVLDDPNVDGAELGVALVAEATRGAHFTGWRLDAADLGARARGSSQCSPMTRPSETAPTFSVGSPRISLRFGETKGTPPRGHEDECAEVTAVPVAYAITATFEEDFVLIRDAGSDAAGDAGGGADVLFQRPAGAVSQAKEIGLAGGLVYWRFQTSNGLSGIATGSRTSPKPTPSIRMSASNIISAFDVDKQVALQLSTGQLFAIGAGETMLSPLGSLPPCDALASDFATVYCRAPSGSGSTLYAASVNAGTPPVVVHALPRGRALAVEGQTFYVSQETGFDSGGSIAVVPRIGDGGAPALSMLVPGQTSPKDIVLGPTQLFWIDDRGGSSFIASAGSKLVAGPADLGVAGANVRFVAADPVSSALYWVGMSSPVSGGSQILRVTVGVNPTTFRAKLTGLGGLAVDETYVYWTLSDGRVYRAPKIDVDL